MKAEHRHELQTNVLADWIAKAADKIRPYSWLITVAICAAAVGVGLIAYINAMERRGKAEAADQLISAIQTDSITDLQATIDAYRGTEPAIVAQLLLAETMLQNGTNTLYSNKLAGRENLSNAAEAFTLAKDEASDPMLRAWALYGLGRAHESMGELERARSDYGSLLKDYPNSSLAAPVRKNLDHLNQPAVKEFYDWFAKQDPRPPAADSNSGIPGMKPPFDLKDPAGTGTGEFKFPSPLDSTAPAGSTTPGSEAAPVETPSSSAPPATETPSDSAKPADATK